eukprot:1157723-Prorocentrum_minimum.AAC.1
MEAATLLAKERDAKREELRALSEALLESRELEIKMNAELELKKLRGIDEKTLEKANRRISKHVASITRRVPLVAASDLTTVVAYVGSLRTSACVMRAVARALHRRCP